MSPGRGRMSVSPKGDFCTPKLMDHGAEGNRPRVMLQATDCGTALCSTCVRSSWSLFPAGPGQGLDSDTLCPLWLCS